MNQEKKEERSEEIENARQKAKEMAEKMDVEANVQKNEWNFTINDKEYRVRKPNFKERQETNQERAKKQVELLREKDENGNFKYLSEKDLIKLYKDRGIDIDEINDKISALREQEEKFMLKLGKALNEKKNKQEIKAYRDKISELRNKSRDLIMDRTELLNCSIEQQILVYVYSFLTSKITEVKENGKWVPAFKNYEEYCNADEEITNVASSYATLILTKDRIINELEQSN